MDDYICKVAVIKTKLRKVKHFENVWIKADSEADARKKIIDKFKYTEGTGLVFIKDIIKKV